MEAAGHELRRAHQLWSDEFRGPWSHGDAGTHIVIYDEKSGRAPLIDFEIVHGKIAAHKIAACGRPTRFLLDLLALAPNRKWLTLVLAFLNAYDDAPVIAHLKNQLAVPLGMAWIWWGFEQVSQILRR